METLTKLFGSVVRVKLMRLFLFQEGEGYSIEEIVLRSQSRDDTVKKELSILEDIGFINYKEFGPAFEEVVSEDEALEGRKIKRIPKPRRKNSVIRGYALNRKFPLIQGLSELLIDSNLITHKELVKYFSHHPHIKLLVLSGIFVKNDDAKADLLIVGEKLDSKRLAMTVKMIESEIGKEIRYSLFSPEEFSYRINMYDKYILDILSSPHERVIEKIEVPRP